MVTVYLDSCSVQRPLDTPTQTRVRLEAEAILGVIEHVVAGNVRLAAAESVDVDFFCTCDDRFFRRARRIPDLRIRVVSPLELIEELEP